MGEGRPGEKPAGMVGLGRPRGRRLRAAVLRAPWWMRRTAPESPEAE